MPIVEPQVVGEIRKKYEGLTDTKRQVAELLVQRWEDAVFMTTEEVAASAGTSPATVVRLAVELGYSGFHELQQHLRDTLKARLTLGNRIELAANGTRFEKAFFDSVEADRRIIDETVKNLPPSSVADAVTLLQQAERIHVIGYRGAHSAASFMALLLNQLMGNTVLLDDRSGTLPEQAISLTKCDVLVAISLPRFSTLTIGVARHAKAAGARVIAITDSVISPLGRLGDVVLPCRYRGTIFQNSLAGAMVIINGLVAGLTATLTPEQLDRSRDLTRRAEELSRKWNLMTVDG